MTGPQAGGWPGFGVLVVSHGNIGAALFAALEHVMGPVAGFRTIGIRPQDSLGTRSAEIGTALRELDRGRGVVVAVDMCGGSPGNLAARAVAIHGAATPLLNGVNLPMLVCLVQDRELPAREAAERARLAAQDGTGEPQALAPDPAAEVRLVICNPKGLHARASAKFAETAARFDAQITVGRDDACADGASILDLLALAATPGTEIRIRATGSDAEAALRALTSLVEGRFGETD